MTLNYMPCALCATPIRATAPRCDTCQHVTGESVDLDAVRRELDAVHLRMLGSGSFMAAALLVIAPFSGPLAGMAGAAAALPLIRNGIRKQTLGRALSGRPEGF